jgi:Phosphatidylinositol-4-phosphate 5-Kinase
MALTCVLKSFRKCSTNDVGGVFFFTNEGSYMIKTIKHDEVKILFNNDNCCNSNNKIYNTTTTLLPHYYRHMQRYGKQSLLTRICGKYMKLDIQQFQQQQVVFYPTINSNSNRYRYIHLL